MFTVVNLNHQEERRKANEQERQKKRRASRKAHSRRHNRLSYHSTDRTDQQADRVRQGGGKPPRWLNDNVWIACCQYKSLDSRRRKED